MYLSFFIILIVLSLTALAVAFQETQDVAGNHASIVRTPIAIIMGKPSLTSEAMTAGTKVMNNLRSNNNGLNSMEQVHLQYWYPTSTTLYSDHGYQYINNGVTFPSFGDNSVSMTVTNNQLTINFLSDVTYILRDVIDHFNGWTLTDVTGGLDFSDARVLQSSASTSLFRLTSTSTIISVNWVGSSFSSGDVIVIGFMSDVSE